MASVLDAWPAAARSSRCWIDEDWSESPGADLRHAGGTAQEFPDHYSVEGESERQRLATSVWLICAGRASEAEGVLRGMLGEGSSNGGIHAYRNLLWALLRQEKHDEVVRTGEKALAAFPSDWDCAFNVAIGAANSGNTQRFRSATRLLRSLTIGSASETRIRLRLMKYESPRLAGPLGATVRSVEAAFGLTPAAIGVRHVVD
jgi:hypothetical protein